MKNFNGFKTMETFVRDTEEFIHAILLIEII